MKGTFRSLVLSLPLLLLVPACRPKEEKVTVPASAGPAGMNPHGATAPARKESTVVVPASQKGMWKAIKVVVTDVATKKESTVVVPLDVDFALPNTGLTLHVVNVLPDFSMGDGVITSKSDSLNNPAAQVKISEGGKEMFKGWMFKLFPEAHAFEHAKVGIKLVELVPAK